MLHIYINFRILYTFFHRSSTLRVDVINYSYLFIPIIVCNIVEIVEINSQELKKTSGFKMSEATCKEIRSTRFHFSKDNVATLAGELSHCEK